MSFAHDLGCTFAFECMEVDPRGRHDIKAVPAGHKLIVFVNGFPFVETTKRKTAFDVLAGFRAGMAYFGKRPRRTGR